MKTNIFHGILVSLLGFLSPQLLRAQGTITYLSNLGQTSTGTLAVGSDSQVAAIFFTGSNGGGYALNSVALEMSDASGSPNSFTAMIYASNPVNGAPGNNLGTLDGSLSPATGGIYTYAPVSNIKLSPTTYYFFVLSSGTSVANGAYELSLAGASSYVPSGGWNNFGGALQTSIDGSSWSRLVADYPEYAISATAIPEPSAWPLFLLGGGVLICGRATLGRISRTSSCRD